MTRPKKTDGAEQRPTRSLQQQFLDLLAWQFDQVDVDELLDRYGTMRGVFAMMLRLEPDRMILGPPIGPSFTAARLAEVRGVSRAEIVRLRKAGEIFSVQLKGEFLFPAVQFDGGGRICPRFRDIHSYAIGNGMNPVAFAVWLNTPSEKYGFSPARLIETAPDSANATCQQYDDLVAGSAHPRQPDTAKATDD